MSTKGAAPAAPAAAAPAGGPRGVPRKQSPKIVVLDDTCIYIDHSIILVLVDPTLAGVDCEWVNFPGGDSDFPNSGKSDEQ